ncbi:MFS transporter [Rhodococcus xishaensis]|uniref:MFS transporter n=1 Tax=Rhodococcus xishaensis TaxID=2487364 RepID=A0A438AT77_9NOCA|nr:MFS transporter [Rhodococcus xishaensis]RVW01870.1 MFS transporter [Rhodococcus xishaensis]
MTTNAPTPAVNGEHNDGSWRRTTSVLSVSQLITWGILYYSFAVYMPQMHADLGWSIPAISAGFAIATLVSGITAPLVGRIIDRSGSRTIMALGAAVGIAGLGLWSAAHHLAVFYLALAIIGLAQAATLYAPAFATVIRHHPTNSRSAIITITLAGGLASTIFSPLAQILSDQGTWRTGLFVLTIGFALTVLPLNYSLPQDDNRDATATNNEPAAKRTGNAQQRPAALWWVAVVWTLTSGVSTAFAVHIVAFLIDNGHGAAAAASIAGAAGIGKVAGRVLIAAGSRLSSTTMLRISLGIQAVALTVPLVWNTTLASLLMVTVFGATAGSLTVLRPILLAELFGKEGFATKNGEVQLITTISKASTPVLAGIAVAAVGYTNTWLGLALIVTVAIAITFRALGTKPSRTPTVLAIDCQAGESSRDALLIKPQR